MSLLPFGKAARRLRDQENLVAEQNALVADLRQGVRTLEEQLAECQRSMLKVREQAAQTEALLDSFQRGMVENWNATHTQWPLTRTPALSLSRNDGLAVPGAENRHRIQGKENPAVRADGNEGFLAGGFGDLRAVINIGEVMGISFDEGCSILDWGVGCGRMARHIPEKLAPGFVGADVDPVNIGWCSAHMPFGKYVVLDPYDRAPFEDDTFDFVYSHSVLTHLAEPDQDHWLRELSRVTRGLMVLSVHGLFSSSRVAWSNDRAALRHYLDRGIVNAPNPNPDISDVTDPGYYRDVAHTPAYIREHWSQFVEVIEIIPRGFGHVHDAVVCRPKS